MNDTKVPHLDLFTAQSLLRRAVEEKGDSYVYSFAGQSAPNCECVYAEEVLDDNGKCQYIPSCIVGHVLYYLGVDLDKAASQGGNVLNALEGLELDGILTYDHDAMVYLSIAQAAQDSGSPWGAAHRAACTYSNFL